MISPKPEIAKRFSFNNKADEKSETAQTPLRRVSADSARRPAASANSNASGLNKQEMDLVRRFSSELQFKSLNDLKSSKIIGSEAELEKELSSLDSETTASTQIENEKVQPSKSGQKDNSNLFPSLDPLESRRLEEEFEKLAKEEEETVDIEAEKLLSETLEQVSVFKSSKKSPISSNSSSRKSSVDHSSPRKASFQNEEIAKALEDSAECSVEPAEAVNKVVISKPTRLSIEPKVVNEPVPKDSSSDADEFQDEINFDPTISSGHLGYKEGGFRNTPIAIRGNESVSQTPTVQLNQTSVHDTSIEAMTETEAENMLSTELLQKRKKILSDEQAEEVVTLLTPDKELPPIPLGAKEEEGHTTSSDIGSSIDSWTVPGNKTTAGQAVDSALDKLDSLVYNTKSSSEEVVKDVKKQISVEKVKETFYDEQNDVHYFADGHYWFEIPAIDITSALEELPDHCYKPPGKIRFSDVPVKQYSTFAIDEYDRYD